MRGSLRARARCARRARAGCRRRRRRRRRAPTCSRSPSSRRARGCATSIRSRRRARAGPRAAASTSRCSSGTPSPATWVPWLATAYALVAPITATLTLTHARRRRAGPTARRFSAADVAFTFELLHRHRALDASGVWDFLAGVRAVDAHTVELHAPARPFVPGLVEVAQQSIVPAHVWRDVADPRHLHQSEPRRHRAVHRGARLSQPGLRARHATRATGSRASPRSTALRMLAYPATTRRTWRSSRARSTGPATSCPSIERTFVAPRSRAQRLLVPADGQHGVPLSEHAARAARRRARAQGAQPGHRSPARSSTSRMYGYTRPPTAPASPTPTPAGAIPPSPPTAGSRTTRAPPPRCSTRPAGAAAPTACAHKDGRRLAFTSRSSAAGPTGCARRR